MAKNKKQNKNAKDVAWGLFESTGSVKYYALYKRLEGKDLNGDNN